MNPATPPSDPELLAAARELRAGPIPEDAVPMLRQIIALARSPAWSEAHVELSVHHFSRGEYELSAEHAGNVLQGRQELVSDRARAIAGIMFCEARCSSDQDVDDDLLWRSAEACLNVQEPRYAAIGFEALGHEKTTVDPRGAREYLERAFQLFVDSGDRRAPIRVLMNLARFSLDQGNLDEALVYRDRAMALVAEFPPHRVGRLLEQQLQKLQDAIAKEGTDA